MSEPVQAQENHDDVIERWKNSSPYEQERLELLQQAIAEGKEKQLYDPEEQKKFGLDGDEFLVCAQCCGGPLYTFFRKIKDLPVFLPILRTACVVFLISFIILVIFNVELPSYISRIFPFICMVLFFSQKDNKARIIIYITNKNIYYGYEKVDGIRSQEFFKKILLNNIDIRHAIPTATHLTDRECYDTIRPFNFHVSKDSKCLLKVLIYRNTEEFNKRHNISNSKYCAVYILKVISCMSKIYNIPLCIQPIHCDFACNR